MKRILLAVLLTITALPAAAQTSQWVTGNQVSTPLDSRYAPYIFVTTVPGNAPYERPLIAGGLTPGVLHTIDFNNGPQWTVQPNLPEGTVAVELSGILIITNATNGTSTPVGCDLQVTFRTPGSTLGLGNFQMQAIAQPSHGARSNASITVTLVNKRLEFFWTYTSPCGNYPSAVAINLSVQKVIWNEDSQPAPQPPLSPTLPPVGSQQIILCNEQGCFTYQLVAS